MNLKETSTARYASKPMENYHRPLRASSLLMTRRPRFRSRHEITWTGYQVHLSETCDPDAVHLTTNVETSQATVHESQKTETIHHEVVPKNYTTG